MLPRIGARNAKLLPALRPGLLTFGIFPRGTAAVSGGRFARNRVMHNLRSYRRERAIVGDSWRVLVAECRAESSEEASFRVVIGSSRVPANTCRQSSVPRLAYRCTRANIEYPEIRHFDRDTAFQLFRSRAIRLSFSLVSALFLYRLSL